MRKFIIWLRINWIKITLIVLLVSLVVSIGVYVTYIASSFSQLENFTKRQSAGMMAMTMPMFVFAQLLVLPLSFGMMWYFYKGGGIGGLTKKPVKPEDIDVKWSDVIGMEDAKKDAREVIRLIKDQAMQKSVGGGIIKGTLILGPPGCGKTYLAKAMATECELPMLTASGSEFVAMFMGQGASRMKSVFKQARNHAKIHGGCIIFIDEIDAFAQTRKQEMGGGATTSHNATINQFLTEMDGLGKKDKSVVVIAATNAVEDDLDPAIMRSGRFDRKIYVEKPNGKERMALIEYYLSKVNADKHINIEVLSDKCKWFSPSDINNLIQEAGIIALRDKSAVITQKHLEDSLRRIISSIERMGVDKILSDKINVKWDDLIGMEETKKDAWEIIELLKDRSRLKVIGGDIIKGVMMIGPPGCGKTYLAKAMATESGYPFISCVGSDFINKQWVGTGIKKLQEVFAEARKVAKSEGGCIIFIDEIDAFIRPRDPKGVDQGGGIHYNSTVNQFLSELDGLKAAEDEGHVVVLAATNVPEGNLDEAVLRSGRFDRKIYFTKPNAKDRKALLEFYLSKVEYDPDIDTVQLAEKAKWFSSADIKNMVRESGILALRENRKIVNTEDLLTALDRVMASIEQMGENKILGGKVNVKWDDVIGMEDAKEESWEIVKMLKDRKMVQAIGGKIVKGVVLFGPPGCGKTYLVKAIATESGFPMISATGSDLVGVYVGEGAKKMKEIFIEARAIAKSEGGCIIFFDEIDSFARHRVEDRGFGGATSHNATINQFLTELDGLRQQENSIFVVGATNVKESDLDSAIMRAGRLERKVYVRRPNLQERIQLFKFYLDKVNVNQNISPQQLAQITIGFTPAEIDNMIREASLIALRENRDKISQADLTESYDRLTIGSLSKKKFTEEEKRKIACHETGHALVTYILHKTDDVIKATIRPRRDYLGYIFYRRSDDFEDGTSTREELMARITISLGGYAAEKVFFGSAANGVWGDFQSIMQTAQHMVWEIGMGKSGYLGNLKDYKSRLSEKTKEILDEDVQAILQECSDQAHKIITDHKECMEYFTKELLKKGDLQHDEISAIFKKFNIKSAKEHESGA